MTANQKKDLFLFFIVIAVVNIAIGFSDGLFSNYFKDVYNTNGFQRGLIEFPKGAARRDRIPAHRAGCETAPALNEAETQ